MWILLFLLFSQTFFADPIGYVTQKSAGLIDTFDTKNHDPGVSVPVKNSPNYLAISPDGKYLYASNQGSSCLSVIDTKSLETLKEIFAPDPAGVAIDRKGDVGYVVSENSLLGFSLSSHLFGGFSIPFSGYGSRNLCLDPEGKTAFVALSNGVAFLDLQEKTSLHLYLEGNIEGLAVSFDGTFLCAASTISPYKLFFIDPKTKSVTKELSLEGIAEGGRSVVISPDQKTVYVTGEFTGNVVAIDVMSKKVQAQIEVGLLPKGAAITEDGSTLYVANFISDDVTPIDLSTYQAKLPIPLTDECTNIVLHPKKLIQDFTYKKTTNSFAFSKKTYITLSWKAPFEESTRSFEVWKDGKLFSILPYQAVNVLEDRNKHKGPVLYKLIAISPVGTKSAPFYLEVP